MGRALPRGGRGTGCAAVHSRLDSPVPAAAGVLAREWAKCWQRDGGGALATLAVSRTAQALAIEAGGWGASYRQGWALQDHGRGWCVNGGDGTALGLSCLGSLRRFQRQGLPATRTGAWEPCLRLFCESPVQVRPTRPASVCRVYTTAAHTSRSSATRALPSPGIALRSSRRNPFAKFTHTLAHRHLQHT
jgi:hypothetical protein